MEDGVTVRRREQRCRKKKKRERAKGDGSTRQRATWIQITQGAK